MKYWALDYVNGADNECELVYNDQLYRTEEAAEAARASTQRPDLFDITWYTIKDLEEVFAHPVEINDDLKVCLA